MRFQSKMYGFSGHIRVQHFESGQIEIAEEKPIPLNDTVLTVIKQDPAVESVSAYATKDAILKGPESFEGLKLKGVEPAYSFVSHERIFEIRKLDSFPG